MNKRLKQRWIKALRSGKYKQTREYLRAEAYTEDYSSDPGVGFCCLGVLCEIMPDVKETDAGYSFELDKKDIEQALKKSADLERSDADDLYTLRNQYGGEDKFEVNADIMLPTPIVLKLGLDKKVQHEQKRTSLVHKLMNMNDAGKSFEQIANYLERVDF